MSYLRQKIPAKHPVDALNTGIYSHLLALFFCLFCNATSIAADTPTVAQTMPLGTLFLTPSERNALELERLRRSRPVPVATPSTKPNSTPTEPLDAPKEATITGLMKRSDGATTVWINGVVQPNFSQVRAQTLVPADVGMVQKPQADLTKAEVVKSRSSVVSGISGGGVTASNQTKPLKANKLNKLHKRLVPAVAVPKIPKLDLLLQPTPIKKRKKQNHRIP